MTRQLTALIAGIRNTGRLCTRTHHQPRTVTEFVENPIFWRRPWSAVRRTARRRNMSGMRQCARGGEPNSGEGRRKAPEELEARSERKREALRRTQQAAAEARRRADEAERLRKEAEYVAQFGVLPPSDDNDEEDLQEGNLPIAVVPNSEATRPAFCDARRRTTRCRWRQCTCRPTDARRAVGLRSRRGTRRTPSP